MATATQVPFEVYLRSEFEPDAEYVNGEILERPMGEISHADWQQAIQRWFADHAKAWNIRAYSEARVQVTPDNYRVPDVAVVDRAFSLGKSIDDPPIAVFEVLSPGDTVLKMKHKLAQYCAMGIPQIWVIDPETAPAVGSFERYESGRLILASRFEQGEITFDMTEIASLLMG